MFAGPTIYVCRSLHLVDGGNRGSKVLIKQLQEVIENRDSELGSLRREWYQQNVTIDALQKKLAEQNVTIESLQQKPGDEHVTRDEIEVVQLWERSGGGVRHRQKEENGVVVNSH